MKIGIIGAGGMGQFHAREFANQGCEVAAILGKNKKSAEDAEKKMFSSFGIKTKVFYDLEIFLKEKLDIVSICTPPEFHSFYSKECLKKGLNVFCEKPLVWDNMTNNYSVAKELVSLAERNNKIITANTQWPSIFPYLNMDISHITSFEMYMEPGVTGIEMLKEHLAHMNSMLVHIFPEGRTKDINIIKKENKEIAIEFNYYNMNNVCKTKFILKYKKERPRAVEFKINGQKIIRKVGEGYSQKLCYLDREELIEDPLRVSIKKFINSVKNKDKKYLLIPEKELLENVALQDELIKYYIKD